MLVYLQVKLDDVMQAVLFYVGSEQTLKMCELKEKKVKFYSKAAMNVWCNCSIWYNQ